MTVDKNEASEAVPTLTLTVETRNLLWVVFLSCVIFEIALVYLDLAVNWQRGSGVRAIRRLFNITREDGLASLFSVIQTLAVAVVLWLIYTVVRHKDSSTAVRRGWLVLAVFFTYMAIDDGAAIHERVGTAADKTAGSSIAWFPSYTWQLVVLPLFVVMGLFVLWFVWRQLPSIQNRLRLLIALSCLGLAVGLDFVEGLDNGYQWLSQQTGWRTTTIAHFSKSLEEFLEMFAMTLLLIIFMSHLANISHRLTVRFQH